MEKTDNQILNEVVGNVLTFTVPSGYSYTIREQNGNDDDIISNPAEASNLMGLLKFIVAIVVKTDFTPSGVLSIEEALDMPILDRYCILFKSRIFSIGKELEFEHDWGEKLGKFNYTQDLEDFVYDYDKIPTPESLDAKKDAIPYYPLGKKSTDIEVALPSGEVVRFDLLTPRGEIYLLELPVEQRTKNKELVARNLRLSVEGKWERVFNFARFTVKDMMVLRKQVAAVDPLFLGNTEIVHPYNPEMVEKIPILGITGFFFPGEI